MKIPVREIVEKGLLTLVVAVVGFLLSSNWDLKSDLHRSNEEKTKAIADLKADVYAAFGTIAETEARSIDNEVRSKVNKRVEDILGDALAIMLARSEPTLGPLNMLQQIPEPLSYSPKTRISPSTPSQPAEDNDENKGEKEEQSEDDNAQVPLNIEQYIDVKRRRITK